MPLGGAPLTNDQLSFRARLIRAAVVDMVAQAGSGHCGGALGLADIFAVLFGEVLKYRSTEPHWEGRDRLVLSNGHTCPVLYAALAEAGYFPRRTLLTLRQLDSQLQGHPHVESTPGVEVNGGPLGQGLGQAIGMVLAAHLQQASWHVWCVLSDGEHQEGATWEGILFAGARKLSGLTVIVDRNKIQIDGPTEEVLPLGDLAAKYQAFGWEVREVEGNNLTDIRQALQWAGGRPGPVALIAHTMPGKGVSFMEGDYHWHGKAPSGAEAEQAQTDLWNQGW